MRHDDLISEIYGAGNIDASEAFVSLIIIHKYYQRVGASSVTRTRHEFTAGYDSKTSEK